MAKKTGKRSSSETNTETPKRSRRGIRRLFWLTVFSAGVVAAAPVVIAKTQLRHELLALVPGNKARLIRIGSADLWWTNPVRLRDVTIDDTSGETLAEVRTISSNKSLLDLVLNANDVGTFVVDQPQISLRVRSDGSNAEDLLNLLPKSESTSQPSIAGRVEINGGTILALHQETGDRSAFHELNAVLAVERTSASVPTVEIEGLASMSDGHNGTSSGRFHIRLRPPEDDADAAGGESEASVALVASSVPLGAFRPLVQRVTHDAVVNGTLQCDVQCRLQTSGDGPSVLLHGDVDIDDAEIASDEWLQGDVLRLASARLGGRIDIDGGRVTFDDVTIKSDYASGTLNGAVDTAAAQQNVAESRLGQGIRFAGDVDVARLSESLPRTLNLRNELKLTDARVESEFNVKPVDGVLVWSGHVRTPRIHAVHRNETVRWDQPIAITFRGQDIGERVILEELTCKSSFLVLNASGDSEHAELHADCDLKRLRDQLSRFVDLNTTRFAGQATLDCGFRRFEGGQFESTGRLELKGFSLQRADDPAWTEANAVLSAVTSGRVEGRSLSQIDDLRIRFNSGSDHAEMQLLRSWQVADGGDQLRSRLGIQGDVSRFVARLRPIVSTDGLHLEGQLTASATVATDTDTLTIDDLDAQVTDFAAAGSGFRIREPEVSAAGGMAFHLAKHALQTKRLHVASTSATADVSNARLALSDTRLPALDGDIRVQGDIARVANWFPAMRGGGVDVQGAVDGTAKVRVTDGTTDATWDLRVHQFRFAGRQAAASRGTQRPGSRAARSAPFVWTEDSIRFLGRATAGTDDGTLEIKTMQLDSEAHQIHAAGTIADVSGNCRVDLTGKTTLDLRALSGTVAPISDVPILLTGRHPSEFSVRGPLWDSRSKSAAISRELVADVAVRWDQGVIYGMSLGPATATARLRDGVVHVTPIETELGGGRLRLLSQVDLRHDQPVVHLANSTSINRLRLSPELCQQWFRYASPLLSDAAQAEGLVSIALQGATIPLSRPEASDVAGTMTIHSATATPGGVAQQILTSTRTLRNLFDKGAGRNNAVSRSYTLRISEQNVDFRMVDGRIHHRNFGMEMDGITVRTSGWVALDQRMSIVAELPLRDEWIKRSRLLGSMNDSTIRLPVGGTLSSPQVDNRIFAQLTRDVAGSVARDYLDDQIRRGLGKLLE